MRCCRASAPWLRTPATSAAGCRTSCACRTRAPPASAIPSSPSASASARAIGLAIANPGALDGARRRRRRLPDVDRRSRDRRPPEARMCILVYNDSSYAAEVHLYRRRGYSIDIVQFPDTDFAAIARGHGARAATVRTLADLEPVRAWVREGAPGVFVIDAKINPNLEADWHAEHFP